MEELAKRAQAFWEAVEADETFKNALADARQAGDVDAAIKLAADKGIELTAEEVLPVIAVGPDSRELDDIELDAVAGGDWGPSPCATISTPAAG